MNGPAKNFAEPMVWSRLERHHSQSDIQTTQKIFAGNMTCAFETQTAKERP